MLTKKEIDTEFYLSFVEGTNIVYYISLRWALSNWHGISGIVASARGVKLCVTFSRFFWQYAQDPRTSTQGLSLKFEKTCVGLDSTSLILSLSNLKPTWSSTLIGPLLLSVPCILKICSCNVKIQVSLIWPLVLEWALAFILKISSQNS